MYIAFLQANTIGRINYTEYIRYQQDVSISEDIIEATRELGVTDTKNTELVVVGSLIVPLNDACEPRRANSAIGVSIYECECFSRNRVNLFIRDMGVEFKECSAQDVEDGWGYAFVNNMPVYPQKGFVALDPESGHLIVRLS